MARRLPPELLLDAGELRPDGLARASWEGKRVDVKNALPGESVKVRVVGRRKGRWLAEAQEVENAHADRVAPVCQHFPRCGGCVMQQLAPHAQLRFKADRLAAALAESKLRYAPEPFMVSGPLTGYRSRARLGVRRLASGVLVGFRESFSNRVLRMIDCQILVPRLARAVRDIAPVLDSLSIADRVPQLEVAAGDQDAEIVLRHLDPLSSDDRQRLAQFERVSGVRMVLQSGGYDTLCWLDERRYEPSLGYANPDYGLHFRFGSADFTQVNLALNRKLVDAAVCALAPAPGERILDLFCGIGNFSLPLVRRGARVTGYEWSASAVDRARANAAHNGLQRRCEFHVADLYDPENVSVPAADKLLLDPPRSGAGPALERWLHESIRTVVYVSCHPDSFAADASRLECAGFRLEQVGIFDMFPHTAHIETLGVFHRTAAGAAGSS